MKKLPLFLIPLLLLGACAEKKPEQQQQQASVQDQTAMSDFHKFKMEALDGEEIDFSRFEGKKVLLVNVASECGYTPQYEDLQKLHEEMGDKVVVLGFPANNFGGQEPGSNAEIASFCEKNFGVDFQMFSKISVKGEDQHPLYSWLREKSGQEPAWNFSKYLVDEKGEVIEFYPSDVNPLDPKIVAKIQ